MVLFLTKLFVPLTILENFDLYDGENRNGNWVLELREKEEKIPKGFEGDIVLDGYCNPIEIMSH